GADETARDRARAGDRARDRGAARRPLARGQPARRGQHVLVHTAAGAREPGRPPCRMIRPTSRIAAVYLLPLVSCSRAVPEPRAPAEPVGGGWVRVGECGAVADQAGELRVDPGSGPGVVVEARARGPAAAMRRAELERRDEGDALRVRFAGRRLVFADL